MKKISKKDELEELIEWKENALRAFRGLITTIGDFEDVLPPEDPGENECPFLIINPNAKKSEDRVVGVSSNFPLDKVRTLENFSLDKIRERIQNQSNNEEN